MATITDMVSKVTQEVLVKKIQIFQNEMSPTFEAMFQSTRRVALDDLGKDWKVIWPFRLGLGGSVQFANMAGPDIATDPSNGVPPGFQVYKNVETEAGLDENVAPAYVQRTVTLKKVKINMFLPMQIIRLAALGASVGDQVEATIDSTAENVGLTLCNAWWSQKSAHTSAAKGVIGTITTPGSSPDITTAGVVVDLYAHATGAKNSIARFSHGQAVDVFPLNSDVRVNQVPVFVDAPDPMDAVAFSEGKIKLFTVQGSVTLSTSTQYELTFRNSGREGGGTPAVPTALDDVLVNTGSVFGVNVATYPILKSKIDAANAVLSDILLLKYFARFHRARPNFYQLDSIVTTAGVLARMFQDHLAMGSGTTFGPATYERNGTTIQMKGGVAGDPTFTVFGKNYTLRTDPFCPQGHLYGLKLNQNWQIVRPPRLAGTAKHPGFLGEIEFKAPLYGAKSGIFLPYNAVGGASAGALTNFLQAPAEMPYELIPSIMPGIKLTGLTEYYG